MKIAPIMRAVERHNDSFNADSIKPVLVHTGQHYDYEMSQVFFENLDLPKPDIHLGIGSGTHAEQTGRIMVEFEKALFKEKPDLVVVVGDVNSTLAGALAAAKLCIPIAHVEAGIRSFDKSMPEEINRLLTDVISDYLFVPSPDANENLKKEGIAEEKIFLVGNVMVDSLLYNKEKAKHSQILSRLGLKERNYALLTLHRPSNVDDKENLLNIIAALIEISQRLSVVFPVHLRTRKRLREFNLLNQSPITNHQLVLIQPLGYLDFLNLEMNARMVITDSGGIQVETTVLGVPCLTILDSPIWTATHEQGTNTLVGSDSQKLTEEAFKILDGGGKEGKCPELWDGKAAERIVEILAREH
ncbi:non-hydrolyzing UDP-N-acetylglucosamine 2-epimerase [Chloroflexota bacterium]